MLKLSNDIYIDMEVPDRLIYLYLDIRDFIKYRILKHPVQQYTIPTHLELIAHREEDGGIWVESDEMPDFLASARSEEEIKEACR